MLSVAIISGGRPTSNDSKILASLKKDGRGPARRQSSPAVAGFPEENPLPRYGGVRFRNSQDRHTWASDLASMTLPPDSFLAIRPLLDTHWEAV